MRFLNGEKSQNLAKLFHAIVAACRIFSRHTKKTRVIIEITFRPHHKWYLFFLFLQSACDTKKPRDLQCNLNIARFLLTLITQFTGLRFWIGHVANLIALFFSSLKTDEFFSKKKLVTKRRELKNVIRTLWNCAKDWLKSVLLAGNRRHKAIAREQLCVCWERIEQVLSFDTEVIVRYFDNS